jgi:chemotaxis protein MotA
MPTMKRTWFQTNQSAAALHRPANAAAAAGGGAPARGAGIALGLAVSTLAIAGAAAWSGTEWTALVQPASFLIVFGGTLGALLVTASRRQLAEIWRLVRELGMHDATSDRDRFIRELTETTLHIRGRDPLAAEAAANALCHPLLREGALAVLDGVPRDELAARFDMHARLAERRGEAAARILENAASIAPAVGVMGTVFGLLNMMREFTNMAAVASGVGTAFVSTLYGLGLANLLLLPLAQRIRAHGAVGAEMAEMVGEAMACVQDRLSPRTIRERLRIFDWGQSPAQHDGWRRSDPQDHHAPVEI